MASSKTQHNFFLVLFLFAAVIMFFVWRPFLSSLILAGSLAIVFYPLYERFVKSMKGSKNLAALTTVLIIMLIVLLPLLVIGSLLFNEVRNLYVSLITNSEGINLINNLTANIQTHLHTIAPTASFNVAEYAQNGVEWLLEHLQVFFSSFLTIVLRTFVMIVALFFMLRDGKALQEKIFLLSPLDSEYDRDIFKKLNLAINSVIKGSLIIGLMQGIFATIGYSLMGIPNPLLWGIAAMLASFIPGIGTSIITIPAIIYLFVTAPLWHPIGLIIWFICGIGLIDNFLTPNILRRGTQIHPFLILISVLGGISFFGPIGVILGPIMLAFFFALLDIYPLIIATD